MSPKAAALKALFEAKSVAVVGVSDDARKQSRIVLRNVLSSGFGGNVYGISRSLTEVAGVRCFPSPADLPEPVDVAFVALPAEASTASVRELAAAKVKVAILGASGFAEAGDEAGLRRQAELTRIVEETGICLVGPNCNGVYNANAQLSIGFNTAHSKRLRAGNIAIFSHSGALFDAMVGQLDRLEAGISIFASAGNEADLDLLDYLDYAIGDAHSKVIALLLDSLSDGDRFRRLAQRAREAGKAIVVLQIGLSEIGAQAAVAHSSRLAANTAAYAALFDSCGVPVVSSIESLMTASALLSVYGKVDGGLAALSSSGAGASLLADLAAKYGIAMASWMDETRARLKEITPVTPANNPTDLGNYPGIQRRFEIPSVIAQDSGVGALVALVQSFPLGAHPILKPVRDARQATGKPFIMIAPGGFSPDEQKEYVEGGLRVLAETENAMQGIAAMFASYRDYPTMPPAPNVAPVSDEPLFDLKRPLTEPESLSLLHRFGIDTVPMQVCTSLDDGIAAAEKMGWPVVVKAVVEGVAHKSDLGLVHVGIDSADAFRTAYRSFPSPATIVVQAMVRGKLEVIAGITKTPDLGLFLVAGLGGIYAEAIGGATLWPIPASRADIERKLGASALGRILSSSRWTDKNSPGAFVDALVNLQAMAAWAGDRLEAVDINPIILGNGRAIAVDALVVPSEAGKK